MKRVVSTAHVCTAAGGPGPVNPAKCSPSLSLGLATRARSWRGGATDDAMAGDPRGADPAPDGTGPRRRSRTGHFAMEAVWNSDHRRVFRGLRSRPVGPGTSRRRGLGRRRGMAARLEPHQPARRAMPVFRRHAQRCQRHWSAPCLGRRRPGGGGRTGSYLLRARPTCPAAGSDPRRGCGPAQPRT
jgi:hypothetical protein